MTHRLPGELGQATDLQQRRQDDPSNNCKEVHVVTPSIVTPFGVIPIA